MTPLELTALREKYEEMLRLRLTADDGSDPRRALVALASRFPGSLREIDELALDEIQARVERLRAAERGGEVLPWMRAVHAFHVLTRGALCAKRWLGGRKVVDASARESFAREAASLCFGDDALPWKDDLERIASPPRGRLTELVYERMARSFGVTREGARALVFGATATSRRARRSP